MLAIAGWFYIASAYQYRGYAMFDETCDNFRSFCESPSKVAILAIAISVLFLIVQTIRK
jgi:hypothetical protein